MSSSRFALAVTVATLLTAAGCSRPAGPPAASTPAAAPAAPVRDTVEQLEAAVKENPQKEAYFGETHVHTSYSLDAYIGGARLTPDEAYKFAQGQEVVLHGQKHSIGRPLDWVAVSDHAEFIGELYSTQVPGAKGGDNPMLVELRGLTNVDEQRAWFVKYVVNNMRSATPGHPPFYAGPETTRSAWSDVELRAVKDNYQPGKFTTLAGFEWTASQNAGNMHVAKATYTNAIGSPELAGSWTDPQFDPKQYALYYVRVLEIPTPRWTTYDAVRNNLELLKDVPATVQERAWTSPIWYTPPRGRLAPRPDSERP